MDNSRKPDFPVVSILITTKNEEKNIGNCLRSIKSQDTENLELIVVDNFSDDKTLHIAEEFGAKTFLKGPERSRQRNYGAQMAKGKYLLYLDADMILDSHLVGECLEKCEEDGFDALYIPEHIVGKGFWIKVRDFERSFYTGTVIDAVRFVRREIFLQLEGFDETLVGPEDWDFDRKIRTIGKVGLADTCLLHNEGYFDMKRYLKKKGYYSDGVRKYVDKWGQNDPETKRQTGMRYRLLGVYVEGGKWKRLVRHPLLTIAMYYLRLRVAVRYVRIRNSPCLFSNNRMVKNLN